MIKKKTLFFMMFSLSLTLVALPVKAQNNAVIQLKLNNTTLFEAIRTIESQSDFRFVYDNTVPLQQRVTFRISDRNITNILAGVFAGKGISYEVTGNQIVLKPQMRQPAQRRNITGTIVDSKGEPVIGATVMVKDDATKGTVTDYDGNFSLADVPQNAIISVSYVGYKSIELPAGSQQPISLVLQEDTELLDEVLVVGYGTQKKTSLTSSVAAIKGKELTDIPLTDLSAGIGGRLAGVIVKQNTGEPGRDGARINIRGISTTGSSTPLLIVDGIPRSFQQLDPNNIESFTVLKDAAAVAPYGVAGANGVILVTTKSGTENKPTLTYHGYIGFQSPTILPEQVNSYEYAILKNVGAVNVGQPKPYSDEVLHKLKDGSDPDAYPPYNNLYGELIKYNSPLTKHNIEISGGTENFKYYGSVGYMYQDGMWQAEYTPAKSNQYNVTMNVDAKVTGITNVSLRLNGSVKDASRPPSDLWDWGTDRIFELIKYAHLESGPLWYSNGMAGTYVSAALATSGVFKRLNTNIFTQLEITQEIPFISGLKLSGLIAYDPSWDNNKTWRTPVHLASINTSKLPYVITDGIFGDTKPSLRQIWNQYQQLTFQAKANYTKQLGAHNFTFMSVFETKNNRMEGLNAYRRNYDVFIDEINMGSSSNKDISNGGTSSDAKQIGIAYRLNYDYLSKYLFEVTGRYDGHYYFAPEKRFGFFPAFSVGWRMSEEKFLKNATWLSNLKLKASYGEVGALAGGPYQYMSLYSVWGPGYVFGSSGVSVAAENAEPNKNITWERAKKTNIGIELGVDNNRIRIEANYFYEKRSNMLVSPTIIVPLEYGIGLSQVNSGIMQNKGIDLLYELDYPVTKDLNIGLTGTFTFAKNKLLQIYESDVTYNNPERRRTGRPLGTQFGYKSIGYFQVDDFDSNGDLKPGIAVQQWGKVYPGDIRYQDTNMDGIINSLDEVVIGNPSMPQIIYGISPRINYKDITLDLFFQGTGLVDAYFFREAVWPFWNGMSAYKSNFDYWTPENIHAKNPRMTPSPMANNTQTSSHWVQDVSYLRLKNATVSYALPSKICNLTNLSNAIIYISGTNLLTFTKLKNMDPEIEYNRGNTYPQQKVISLGINVTF